MFLVQPFFTRMCWFRRQGTFLQWEHFCWRFPDSFSSPRCTFEQFFFLSLMESCNRYVVYIFIPLITLWREIGRTPVFPSNACEKEQPGIYSEMSYFYLFSQCGSQNKIKIFFSIFSFRGSDSLHLLPNYFLLLLLLGSHIATRYRFLHQVICFLLMQEEKL